ncbi:type II toxin-antitoxin system VapB family antitoxin [soil metagenome]
MAQSNLFKSNRSQAVRLPKHLEFPEHVKRVDVISIGSARVISPAGSSWESYFDGRGVSSDFMTERDQPPPQKRDEL